ncbi:MAG: hypothetical protein HQ564_03010 [Candidatus Saganbacteria bacterium]|nr:hypothetical protein [Candidatus Saganbacteria bacterium]
MSYTSSIARNRPSRFSRITAKYILPTALLLSKTATTTIANSIGFAMKKLGANYNLGAARDLYIQNKDQALADKEELDLSLRWKKSYSSLFEDLKLNAWAKMFELGLSSNYTFWEKASSFMGIGSPLITRTKGIFSLTQKISRLEAKIAWQKKESLLQIGLGAKQVIAQLEKVLKDPDNIGFIDTNICSELSRLSLDISKNELDLSFAKYHLKSLMGYLPEEQRDLIVHLTNRYNKTLTPSPSLSLSSFSFNISYKYKPTPFKLPKFTPGSKKID